MELVACEDMQGQTVWRVTLMRAMRVYREYMLGQILCLAVVCVAKVSEN